MNDYERRQEDRRARLERAAERARADAASRFRRADQAVEGIPSGQPILVGHHSERRHRRALERQDQHMRAGLDAMQRSRDLANRAAGVGQGGVSSDDPDAVPKLRERLAELERKQDRYKAINAAIRKHRKAGADAQRAALVATGISEALAVKLTTPDECGQVGIPTYALSNNRNNMRRIAKRIADLDAVDRDADPVVHQVAGATVTADPAENRVFLRFPARLDKAGYRRVRSCGFVWNRTAGAFSRKYSAMAEHQALQLATALTSHQADPDDPQPEGPA